MSLVLVTLLVAVVVGRLRGGSLDALGALPLRARRLVAFAFLAQLVGTLVGGPVHPLGLAVSGALVVGFLLRNRGVRGTGLVALGVLANALVVAANGAMPVSAPAADRAGVSTDLLVTGADPRHELAGPGTVLPWLGDVVPVALPLRPEVVSPGDVLVTAGVAQLVVAGMLHGRPAALPARLPTHLPAPLSAQRPARRPLPPAPRRQAPRPVRFGSDGRTGQVCDPVRRRLPAPRRSGGPPWPSEAASGAAARSRTPTTASAPTPDPYARRPG